MSTCHHVRHHVHGDGHYRNGVRRLEAVPFDPLIGQPTRHSVSHLINQLAGFTSYFSSSHWEGRHGYLSLVLSDAEMRLVTGDASLDCSRLPLPARINARITDATFALLSYNYRRSTRWNGRNIHSKPFWMQLVSKPSSLLLMISMSRNSRKTKSNTKTK